MGVPALFAYFANNYPSIVYSVVEEKAKTVSGITVNVNLKDENPNRVEFDNLYLDLNGIVHPCCHPEGEDVPPTEQHMMIKIFEYIDRIMLIVRPRKLLYIAIDGVAPRAKMNQQRSRRFRAAKEAQDLAKEIEDNNVEKFDSNCITPGTPFMSLLTKSLRYYIAHKMSTDPGWKELTVILSDASVPGEGEHKIMDYIRRARSSPDYNPNTFHILYGLDADLIMLSLATHEPNFRILREDVQWQRIQIDKYKMNPKNKPIVPVPFVFLDISELRHHLAVELAPSANNQLVVKFDLERSIDDYIFILFFIGNDFLPHIPSLGIRDNGVNILINTWRQTLEEVNEDKMGLYPPVNDGGFLTDCGLVKLGRFYLFLKKLSELEDKILLKKWHKKERLEKRYGFSHDTEPKPKFEYKPNTGDNFSSASALRKKLKTDELQQIPGPGIEKTNAVEPKIDVQADEVLLYNSGKRKRELTSPEASEEPPVLSKTDVDLKLGFPGYQQRYYKAKFGLDFSDKENIKKISNSYVIGLIWVLHYYYQGVPSWTWFYDYHYPPFASDLLLCEVPNYPPYDATNTGFVLGEPFRPFEQLMAVLPASSGVRHLPSPFHSLMLSNTSPILDFYPNEFEIDLDGVKYAWQGVVILPFIDETRLLTYTRHAYPLLSDEEIKRNSDGFISLYFSKFNSKMLEIFEETISSNSRLELNPILHNNLVGSVKKDCDFIPDTSYPSPLLYLDKNDIVLNKSYSLEFLHLDTPGFKHHSRILEGFLPTLPINLQKGTSFRNFRGKELNRYIDNKRGRGGIYNDGDYQSHCSYSNRGSYNRDRGGNSGNRGNYYGNYGNYSEYRGNFNGNRGDYNVSRDTYKGNYGNGHRNRGGYNGNQGDNNSRGKLNSRGTYGQNQKFSNRNRSEPYNSTQRRNR